MAIEPLVDGHGRRMRKELKHHIGELGFVQPVPTMSAIGG
jgi:hypothetical protein